MAEKTEKKSGGGQIIKLALVLFAVSAIMALALGLVNELTKGTIAMRAAETTKKAYASVTAELQADDYRRSEVRVRERQHHHQALHRHCRRSSRSATSPRLRSPARRA